MNRYVRGMRRNSRVGRGVALALASCGGWSLPGCGSSPRLDVEASEQAAMAVGVEEPIEFRAVGPEGGPLDEPGGVEGLLPMAEALRRAVSGDPSLQAALARVRIAMADADQARLLPNPVLSVVLRWGPGESQIEASVAQDIVRAIQRPRASSAADHRLRQAAAGAVTVALDTAVEVQERYISAQASAAILLLLRERFVLIEQLAGVAKARLGAGEGTRSDLATLEAQRVELQVEIERAVLTEREERVRLARLIGEPSSSADWALDAWPLPAEGMATEVRCIEAALAHRPEVRSIEWKLRALGDEEALVGALAWDGVSAGVDGVSGDAWAAGPSVSSPLPVFDSGQARRARLTAEQFEARHELTLARRRVVEEVRLAHQTMTGSVANLARIRTELIPLQQQRRLLALESYRAGQSDVTALYLAEHDLRLSQSKGVEVELQAAIARVRLRRAVGGPGVEGGISRSPAAFDGRTRVGAPASSGLIDARTTVNGESTHQTNTERLP
ncbi:MAG: TolC family protein [Phycisphaerales bacterium]|jgi:cobalt-zinc-cadmium efflux system outer membrane protein|nr:TolC family protein [Phycisphaerales bacterium]